MSSQCPVAGDSAGGWDSCGVKHSLRKLHDLSIADLRPIYFAPTGFPVFLLATHDTPPWWLRDFLDEQQIVGRVVAVGGSAIFSALVDKPADCVPLEVMADGGRSFGAFYTCPEMGWRVVLPYDFLYSCCGKLFATA